MREQVGAAGVRGVVRGAGLGLMMLCAVALARAEGSRTKLAAENGGVGLPSLQSSEVVGAGGARVVRDDAGARLEIDQPADASLDVKPVGGRSSWDLSGWTVLAVDVKNLSPDRQARLVMTVTAAGDDGKPHQATVGVGLNPGEERTLRMPLPHKWEFGAPKGVPGVRVIDTARVEKLSFGMQWPFERGTPGLLRCELTRLRVEGRIRDKAPMDEATYAPFIDRYGQDMHADWPGKIHRDADLKAAYARETQELEHSKRPEPWDRFGGWKDGPQLKATGSFRTEKYAGKWWFVDPDGRLFLSQGLDVLKADNETLKVMPGKENWFAELPAGAKSYNAVGHNLQVKYGTDEYAAPYLERLTERLQAWGINSIGDWSSTKLMALENTPYTLELTDYDGKMPKIAGSKVKFYDVFDPAYEAKMRTLLRDAAKKDPMIERSLTDPMCIGYFIDNELNFGDRGKMVLVDDIMRSPAQQAAKRAFVDDLRGEYGEIARLNAAWRTKYASWEAVLTETSAPEAEAYRADSMVFFRKVVERYFRLAHDAVKSVAPNRLYLGARFISTDAVRPELYEMCAKYCDVLSVNIYAHSAANFPNDDFPDMPVLVTEFQFGLLQRGMFSASLCQAGVTPEDRATAYERFLQGVLVHPKMVGAQWFQYRDQPLTGRGDGEAYQIGFVDVTDTPYDAMTRVSREVGEGMYAYRMRGKLVNSMEAK